MSLNGIDCVPEGTHHGSSTIFASGVLIAWSFIALETAEVFAGAAASALVQIPRRLLLINVLLANLLHIVVVILVYCGLHNFGNAARVLSNLL